MKKTHNQERRQDNSPGADQQGRSTPSSQELPITQAHPEVSKRSAIINAEAGSREINEARDERESEGRDESAGKR